MKNLNLGIFGATGMVGQELIKLIAQRKLLINNLELYASARSAGRKIETPVGDYILKDADTADYNNLDIALFAIGKNWPKENAHKAVQAGCLVIDSSSTFRYNKDVPLVIPEINSEAIGNSLLIANPNCTTAIASIPLWEIYKNFGLKKVFISTYQAASGAGAQAMLELENESRRMLSGKNPKHKVFAHPLPFNIIPHIDEFQENAYTREEMKVVWETRKIFNDENIPISCTSVRIPTMRAHAESIVVETKEKIDIDKLRQILANTNGIELRDDIEKNIYPMPITASEKYNIEVGRIRKNLIFGDYGLEFFICGDQILKGAALNTIQIAELVIKNRF